MLILDLLLVYSVYLNLFSMFILKEFYNILTNRGLLEQLLTFSRRGLIIDKLWVWLLSLSFRLDRIIDYIVCNIYAFFKPVNIFMAMIRENSSVLLILKTKLKRWNILCVTNCNIMKHWYCLERTASILRVLLLFDW